MVAVPCTAGKFRFITFCLDQGSWMHCFLHELIKFIIICSLLNQKVLITWWSFIAHCCIITHMILVVIQFPWIFWGISDFMNRSFKLIIAEFSTLNLIFILSWWESRFNIILIPRCMLCFILSCCAIRLLLFNCIWP